MQTKTGRTFTSESFSDRYWMTWPQLIQSPRLWPAGRGITVGSRGMHSFLFGAVLMVALISMGVTTDAAQKRRGLRDYFWPSTSLRRWWSACALVHSCSVPLLRAFC